MLVIPLWKALSSFPLSKVLSGAFRGIFLQLRLTFYTHSIKSINECLCCFWALNIGDSCWAFVTFPAAEEPLITGSRLLLPFGISWLEVNSHHLDSIKKCAHFLRLQQFICHLTKDMLPFFHLIYFPDKEFPAKRSVASESAFLCWAQCSNNRL